MITLLNNGTFYVTNNKVNFEFSKKDIAPCTVWSRKNATFWDALEADYFMQRAKREGGVKL